MIKTYIFGTPHGFDFYENDEFYKNYFLGFYRSSYQGRRLVVNRRSSGETVYTFLQYGLMEKQGRPNSYFGMSMVCKSGYTTEFKKLYEWFCFMFEKLIARGGIFTINGGGNTQYKVSKFQDAFAEIDWVKTQLPNIFSSNANTPIINYNNSFSWKKTGKVFYHNIEDDLESILSDFKIGLTIALSESFEKSISVDYNEMVELLGDVHEKLLPIAVNLTPENSSVLKTLQLEIEEADVILDKYIPTISGSEDKELYIGLSNKIKSTISNITQLIKKCEKPQDTQVCSKCGHEKSLSKFKPGSNICTDCSTVIVQPEDKKQCSKCKRTKTLAEFEYSTDTICKECKTTGWADDRKKCIKCNRELTLDNFTKGAELCNYCQKKDDIATIFIEFINKHLKVILIIVAVVTAALVIPRIIPEKTNTEQEQDAAENRERDIVNDDSKAVSFEAKRNVVDDEKFDNYCLNNNFEEAFTEIRGKEDEQEYRNRLRINILEVLSSYFETNSTSAENLVVTITKFRITIPTCIDELDLDEEFRKYETAADFFSRAMALLKKEDAGKEELQKTSEELGVYKSDIPAIESIVKIVNEKLASMTEEEKRLIEENKKATEAQANDSKTVLTFYVQDTDGLTIVGDKNKTTDKVYISCKPDQFVVIELPDRSTSKFEGVNGAKTRSQSINRRYKGNNFRWEAHEGTFIFSYKNTQITVECKNFNLL